MRVTTNMMMRNYNTRLNTVLNDMNIANQKVITRRKFLTAAESPADASRAYQLRRSMQQNADYLSNLENVADTFTSVESNLMKVSSIAETAYVQSLEAINGTKSLADRKIFAGELRSMQKSVVMNLNSQFDNKFLFGGSSTKELPFELSQDGTKLTFRGLDVSDPDNQALLAKLANETINVDLGFGMKSAADGSTVQSSVFNTAQPGLKFIGFGTDPTDNFVLNLGKLASELEKDPMDNAAVKVSTDKLNDQRMNVLIGVTKLGSDSKFLSQTRAVLEDNSFNLNKKILGVEYMDMEEAITAFKAADYVYKAALKMGMNILSPSFIDFMS